MEEQLYTSNDCCDTSDVYRYTNLFINRLTNNRNDYVVTSNNEPNRKTHGQTVNNARRYGKTGAQAQS